MRQLFNYDIGYKILDIDWCCNRLKDNPIIDLTSEYSLEIPQMQIIHSTICRDWEDEWEEQTFYPITYCPFCGEPIEIEIIDTEDVSETYDQLTQQIKELRNKKARTDSINKMNALDLQIQDLYKKIDYFHNLAIYDSNII